jgi:hypothetical protein
MVAPITEVQTESIQVEKDNVFVLDEVTGETMPSITEPVKKLEPKYDYEEPFSFKEKKGLDGGNF